MRVFVCVRTCRRVRGCVCVVCARMFAVCVCGVSVCRVCMYVCVCMRARERESHRACVRAFFDYWNTENTRGKQRIVKKIKTNKQNTNIYIFPYLLPNPLTSF